MSLSFNFWYLKNILLIIPLYLLIKLSLLASVHTFTWHWQGIFRIVALAFKIKEYMGKLRIWVHFPPLSICWDNLFIQIIHLITNRHTNKHCRTLNFKYLYPFIPAYTEDLWHKSEFTQWHDPTGKPQINHSNKSLIHLPLFWQKRAASSIFNSQHPHHTLC